MVYKVQQKVQQKVHTHLKCAYFVSNLGSLFIIFDVFASDFHKIILRTSIKSQQDQIE